MQTVGCSRLVYLMTNTSCIDYIESSDRTYSIMTAIGTGMDTDNVNS
jgi:hypothetical protein